MLVSEELEEIFELKSCLFFHKKANVKLYKEKGLVLDYTKSCFNKKKTQIIPYHFLLAVETHITQKGNQNESMPFMDMDIRFLGSQSKNSQKVFDKALEGFPAVIC